MNNTYAIILKALQARPDILNSPRGQEFARILQSGDEKAGIAMANNLRNSYGISDQDTASALSQVKSYFNFGNN